MKEVSHYIRQSYINALGSLKVNNIAIPVADEQLPITVQPAEIHSNGKAYVIVRDQQEVPSNFNKCGIVQDAAITLDVITKFPKGAGSKLTSELISDEIQKIVNPFRGEYLTIDPQFHIMSITKDLSQGLVEYTDTEVCYRKIIIYTNTINEI